MEFPQVIIQHILSFLLSKEAARSMVLSKAWLRAWSTRHFLDFDQAYFGIKPGMTIDPAIQDKLLRLVIETLESYSQQKISIQKFRLHIDNIEDDKFLPFIEKWLPMVLQSNVVELDFRTRWQSSLLPPEIFGLTSLQVLEVSPEYPGANLWLVLDLTDIMCRNLKTLHLNRIVIDDVTFQNLISCCPLIEVLVLSGCPCFKVHIANLPYLEQLHLYYSGTHDIYIDAPKLQLLNCVTWTRINIGESGNLKLIYLGSSDIEDEQMQNILSKNPLLEHLRLDCCRKLTQINFSSRSLKSLRIHRCVHLVEGVIDAPNLHVFVYQNRGKKCLYIRSPRPIINPRITIGCPAEIDASWFHDLREFLNVFKKSTVVINSSCRNLKFNSEGFTPIPLPYGHEVEMLKLNYQHSVCIELLDALLSICHPKTVLCSYPDTNSDNASVRNFCKKLKSTKIPKCCNSDEIKCWRHYLKDVKLYHMVDNEKKPLQLDRSFLRRFFTVSTAKTFSKVRISFTLEWKDNE